MKRSILPLIAVATLTTACSSVTSTTANLSSALGGINEIQNLSEKAEEASQKVVAVEAITEIASNNEAIPTVRGDFDPVVIPGKALKGRFNKSPYPDVMGDTRKWTGVKKVSIPRYIVTFDKKAGESSSASAGWTGPTANTHVHAKLEGVEEGTFKRITNLAYQDFETKMRQAGYEVLGIDQIKNGQEYQGWSTSDFPKVKKGSSSYMADGMRSFSQFKQYFRHGNLMNETQAALVEPKLMVNFAAFGKQSTSRTGFNSSEATASVSMGPSVHVSGSLAGTTLNKCDKRGQCFGDAIQFHTGQVTYSERPFGNIKDTTNKGAKAVQGALNALSMLSGTSTRSDSEKTVYADSKAYEAAALDALFQANTRFVNKLLAADKT